jgi:DNA primase
MQTPRDQPETNQATDRRVTVQEAASLLGISEDAVRSRLKRGTLRREKGRDGTVYVLLGSVGHTNRPTTNQPTIDQPTTEQSADQSTLSLMQAHLDSLQEQLDYLRDQLDQERGANRENRRIIAGLVNRIPELEAAPQDASPDERESPQSASEPRSDKQQASQGYPEGEEQPVSWWRRLFGT